MLKISPDDSHILIWFRKCSKITCLCVPHPCFLPLLQDCVVVSQSGSPALHGLVWEHRDTLHHSTGQSQNTAVWWHALPLLSSRSSTLDASLPAADTAVHSYWTSALRASSLSQLLTSTASWETTCLYSVTGVSSFCPFMCHSTLTSLGPEGKLHLHVDPTGYLALTQCEQDTSDHLHPQLFVLSSHSYMHNQL